MNTVDDSRLADWQAARRQRGLDLELPLNGGGGGGTYDSMEPRIAKLEAHMEHANKQLDKLSDVPAILARIEERLNHTPTKIEALGYLGGAIVLAGAIITILSRLGWLIPAAV